MTKSEFIGKYGSVKVKFVSYYKYTFTYEARLPDGKQILCWYGGSADAIYRHEVIANQEETIESLHPCSGSLYENGKEIDGFEETFNY